MHRPVINKTATTKSLCAAVLLAAFVFPAQVRGQASDFDAPGRVEGTGPTMPVGTAASGTVSEILVLQGSRVRAGQNLAKLDCRPIEADLRAREAQVAAAQATFDRFRNGSRADEIAVGEAAVGYSKARADEAEKTLERTEAMREGVSVTTARVLEVKRDARITAALLAEASARLSLLRAGSREEDIRQAEALRNVAVAELEGARARLDQCSVRAPVDGTVLDIAVTLGQFLSSAVPQPLLHMVQDGPLRVRADIELRDLAHVCLLQSATVSAEAFPKTLFHAQVVSISPAVSPRSITRGPSDAQDRNVVSVILKIAPGDPVLPIGLPVTARFDHCPPKT
jgi:multidrug resistance efflux pump